MQTSWAIGRSTCRLQQGCGQQSWSLRKRSADCLATLLSWGRLSENLTKCWLMTVLPVKTQIQHWVTTLAKCVQALCRMLAVKV